MQITESTQRRLSFWGPHRWYGYLWWSRDIPTGIFSEISTYFASGLGGQKLYVIPDLDMVIVVYREPTRRPAALQGIGCPSVPRIPLLNPTSTGPRMTRKRVRSKATRTMARWMFHAHLWLGVLVTVGVLQLCITGILLNHKRALGLIPDVDNPAAGPLSNSLPLAQLVEAARTRLGSDAPVSRMDVRPSDGFVKVRFNDASVTEVTVDLVSGSVLYVGFRNDVFLEKLHSGEIFGDRWILLSDITAVALCLLVLSGYWIWLYPRSRG